MMTATATIADGKLTQVSKSKALAPKGITGQYIADALVQMADIQSDAAAMANRDTRPILETILLGIFPLSSDEFKTIKADFKAAREAGGYKDAGPRASELARIYGAHKYVQVPVMDESGTPLFDEVEQDTDDGIVTVEVPRMTGWTPNAYSWNQAAQDASTVLKEVNKSATGADVSPEAKAKREARRVGAKAEEAVGLSMSDLASMSEDEQAEALSKLREAVSTVKAQEAFESLEKHAERIAKMLIERYVSEGDIVDMLTLIAKGCGYDIDGIHATPPKATA